MSGSASLELSSKFGVLFWKLVKKWGASLETIFSRRSGGRPWASFKMHSQFLLLKAEKTCKMCVSVGNSPHSLTWWCWNYISQISKNTLTFLTKHLGFNTLLLSSFCLLLLTKYKYILNISKGKYSWSSIFFNTLLKFENYDLRIELNLNFNI